MKSACLHKSITSIQLHSSRPSGFLILSRERWKSWKTKWKKKFSSVSLMPVRTVSAPRRSRFPLKLFFSTKARRTHLQFCLREKESLEPKNRYPWSGAMSLSLLRGTSVGENSGVGWGKRLLFAWVQGSAH